MLDALKEQLQASTAETQASRAEADRLRSALTDAELELQQVTSANAVARREEQVTCWTTGQKLLTWRP